MTTPTIDRPDVVVPDEDEPGALRFRASKCTNCGSVWFPLRKYCANCQSAELEYTLLPAEGTLYSYSIVHLGRPGTPVPYALGVVVFGDDVSVFGKVLGWEDGIEVGQRVRAGTAPADEVRGDPRADYRLVLVAP